MGIVDPKALGQIAASFSMHGAVLSTIGMGLGFNETLLASLADYGMGNYSYLEHLATLGSILQKDLHDAKQVFASASSLELVLSEGITVSDIGGYPIERSAQPEPSAPLPASCLRRRRNTCGDPEGAHRSPPVNCRLAL
jgi:Ca-activated chloride channel family protein